MADDAEHSGIDDDAYDIGGAYDDLGTISFELYRLRVKEQDPTPAERPEETGGDFIPKKAYKGQSLSHRVG